VDGEDTERRGQIGVTAGEGSRVPERRDKRPSGGERRSGGLEGRSFLPCCTNQGLTKRESRAKTVPDIANRVGNVD
jgi:hypothetical protein